MAEAKKASEPAAKPLNDVAPADQTAPDPTAKPVLVSNRPIMKDPMVVEGDQAASDLDEHTVQVKIKPKAELKITPDAGAPTDEPGPEQAPEEPKVEEKPGTPVAPAEPEPQPKADEPAKEDEKPADEQNTDSPDPAAMEEAEAAKQAEHEAAIQKLAESKQYYLPVNTVEKRKSKRFVMLGIVLSVVLAVAWVDVALDAGIIQINGIKPVTHFFSN